MKLIVGLGNPGRLYIDSRHNIGFSVIKALAKIYKISLKKGNLSLSGKAEIGSQNVILAMPLTFMNLSGTAVAGLLKKYRIDLANLLVVCDDLDLEFGRLKLRPSGSSGGHRGLKSIIDCIGSQGFVRLRIGIGRPFQDIHASDYVLSPFTRKEKEQVRQIIEKAGACCQSWVTKGVTETMNIFNKRRNTDE
jgi:PTH1 family peptidyl-tRNA hydrolase